jgi:diaminopimelate decarboxylase
MVDLSLFPPTTIIDGEDPRVGGCSLTAIANDFGTPVFVIDEAALKARAREYIREFKNHHPRSRIHFAVKSFPSASIIRVLAAEGVGCDVVGADPWSRAARSYVGGPLGAITIRLQCRKDHRYPRGTSNRRD